MTLVGVGDALLVRAAVFEQARVRIEHHQAVGQRGDRCMHVAHKGHRRLDDRRAIGRGVRVHALTRDPFRGHPLQPQRRREESVLAKAPVIASKSLLPRHNKPT